MVIGKQYRCLGYGWLALVCLTLSSLGQAGQNNDLVAQSLAVTKTPGASYARLSRGEIAEARGYGVKTLGGEAVDRNTIFEAASLSKAVFGYIVLQLVDEGKVDLDKPLHSYFPEPLPSYPLYRDFAEDTDELYKLLTPRHVLSHTSGLPNWRNVNDDNKLKFSSKPGSEFIYSGEGFQLLQAAVQAITGKNLETLAQERVFKPLGMQRSSYAFAADTATNYASGTSVFGKTIDKGNAEEGSAYSLHTSAYDYALFLQALYQRKGLKPETFTAFFSEQTPIIDNESGATDHQWGLGIAVLANKNNHLIWHGGSNDGFKNIAVLDVFSGDGLVLLTNSDKGMSNAGELITGLFPDYNLTVEQAQKLMGSRYPDEIALALQLTESENPKTALQQHIGEQEISAELAIETAMILGREGFGEAAAALQDYIMAAHAEHPRVRYEFAMMEMQQGNYAQALEKINQLLKTNPGYDRALVLKGSLQNWMNSSAANANFVLPGHSNAKQVMLAGSFNNWQDRAQPMRKTDDGWVLHLPLAPGEYQYKYVVDGEWITDPTAPTKIDGDYKNSYVVIEGN